MLEIERAMRDWKGISVLHMIFVHEILPKINIKTQLNAFIV